MTTQFECTSWQGFVQQLVMLSGRGYTQYKLTILPERKRMRFAEIDQKMAEQYSILKLSKYQKARRKTKGLINGHLLRWDKYSVLLLTKGEDDCAITTKEKMTWLGKQRLQIEVSKTVTVEIVQNSDRITVQLAKSCYQDLKSYYEQAAKNSRNEIEIQNEFKGLDYFVPSWSGALAQKKKIRRAMMIAAKQQGRSFKSSDYPVRNKKKTYKVFSEEAA